MTMKHIIFFLIFNLMCITAYPYNQTFKSTSPYLQTNTQYEINYTPTSRTKYVSDYNVSYSVGQSYLSIYKPTTFENPYKTYEGYPYGNTTGPRRITVYNGDGGTQETPGGKKDGKNWLYRYDEVTGEWWCSTDGGLTWKKWDSLWGWGIIGYAWREDRGDPTEESVKYHHDPNSDYLAPVGDLSVALFVFILLCCIGYDIFKRYSKDLDK